MERGNKVEQAQVKRAKRWTIRRRALIAVSVILVSAGGRKLISSRRHSAALTGSVAPVLPATPPGIVLHHSYTPGIINGNHVGMDELSKMHEEIHPGWAETYEGKTYYVGYHYIIRTDGVVEQGRPELCPGAHARKFNNWLGICLIGDFATHTRHNYKPNHPTAAQMKSLITLCESLMAKYHIPPQMIMRHRDVNTTWCPGDNFPYHKLIATLTAYTNAHPEMYPTPPVILKIVRTPARRK